MVDPTQPHGVHQTMVNSELKQAAESRVREAVDILNKAFNRSHPYPLVLFDLKGRRAGVVTRNNVIRLNPILLNENRADFVSRIPGHEVAHLFDYIVYGGWGHSNSWKHVMRTLGQSPDRCHDFNTANVARGVRVDVECANCNTRISVSKQTAIRMSQGRVYTHRCGNRTRGRVHLIGAIPTTPAPSRPAQPTAPTPGSKLDAAKRVFETMNLERYPIRKEAIRALAIAANLPTSTATTYYQRFKAERLAQLRNSNV